MRHVRASSVPGRWRSRDRARERAGRSPEAEHDAAIRARRRVRRDETDIQADVDHDGHRVRRDDRRDLRRVPEARCAARWPDHLAFAPGDPGATPKNAHEARVLRWRTRAFGPLVSHGPSTKRETHHRSHARPRLHVTVRDTLRDTGPASGQLSSSIEAVSIQREATRESNEVRHHLTPQRPPDNR